MTPGMTQSAVGHAIAAGLLLIYPLLVPPFWASQIGAQALILGVIALSLTFLAGYGGMVSLAQMTVAGCAGYFVAILGASASDISLGLPWWAAVPLAIAIAVVVATLVGALAARTQGIYTIMITLAIAVAFFYLAQQNYALFNGFDGFKSLEPPRLFGVAWRGPVAFFYLALAVAALCYAAVRYVERSTFGLALQGVRDNARRMEALGFAVFTHRVAAYAFAGLIAALGGVMSVWYHARISPGSVGVDATINILIIAVLGGMRRPVGPFIGAVLFVLLQNFAIDLIDRERFNALIGAVFLAVVLFSPDGVLGLWAKLRQAAPRRTAVPERPESWQTGPNKWSTGRAAGSTRS
jgi:branched-chain amino acid transport system permease protein